MVRVPIEQRRPQLIAAATAVIAREGIAAATTRAIAAEAGVALGVVHYVYASKDELLADVITSITNQLGEAAHAAVAPEPDLAVGIKRCLFAMWGVVEAAPDAQLAIYELTVMGLRNPELKVLVSEMYREFIAAAGTIVQAQLAASGMALPYAAAAVARMIECSIDGLILAWLVDRDFAVTSASVDVFVDMLCAVAVPA